MTEQQKSMQRIDQTATIPGRRRTIITLGVIIAVMITALFAYIQTTILSQRGVLFSVYIPSKTSSGEVYMDSIVGAFVVAAVVAVALLFLAWGLMLRAKWIASSVVTIATIMSAATFAAIFLGNALNYHFGVGASVAGVIICELVGFAGAWYVAMRQIINQQKKPGNQ